MKDMEIWVVVLIGVGFFSLALAGDNMDRPTPPTFSDIDANGDQLISQDEMRTFMEGMMARMHARKGGRHNPFERGDADGDGYLNEEEFNEMRNAMRGMRHNRFGNDEPKPDDDAA